MPKQAEGCETCTLDHNFGHLCICICLCLPRLLKQTIFSLLIGQLHGESEKMNVDQLGVLLTSFYCQSSAYASLTTYSPNHIRLQTNLTPTILGSPISWLRYVSLYVVTLLDWTPIFEWYTVRPDMYYNEFELCAQSIDIILGSYLTQLRGTMSSLKESPPLDLQLNLNIKFK